MRLRHSLAGAALTGALLFGAAARAVPVTFEFGGTVGGVTADPADPFGGDIATGTPFTGAYTFESTAGDSVPADPQTGSYFFFGAGSGLTVDFGGGHVFDLTDALNIAVNNDFPGGDIYTVLGTTSTFDPVVELELRDDSGSAFADDDLPLDAPAFGTWSFTRFSLFANDLGGNQVEIQGALDSLECTAGCVPVVVPGPGTLSLLWLGLSMIGARYAAARALRTLGAPSAS